MEILGGDLCYKDSHGDCYQNGRNRADASIICKEDGRSSRKYYE